MAHAGTNDEESKGLLPMVAYINKARKVLLRMVEHMGKGRKVLLRMMAQMGRGPTSCYVPLCT